MYVLLLLLFYFLVTLLNNVLEYSISLQHFLFSHPVWDCNFQKSDDYILPIFQRGVIQTISQ